MSTHASEFGLQGQRALNHLAVSADASLLHLKFRMDGETYRSLRDQLGLTQAGLAEMLGLTRATISAREAERTSITEEAAIAIRALVISRRALQD